MRTKKPFNLDHIYFAILLLLVFGLPFGIRAYDRSLEPHNLPPGTKSFTLVGNAQKGWLVGEVQAYNILTLWNESHTNKDPIIEVDQGDQVVLKLRSSDVTHGFSLKAFGVFPGWMPPGR